MTTIPTSGQRPCGFWPFGQCKQGAECPLEHHNALDAAWNDGSDPVPNELGTACSRCLERVYPCDKKGRGGGDDPCSECRWFGGENCQCVLVDDSSYNDSVWRLMMKRGPDNQYTLPAYRGREVGNWKKTPQPMSAKNVKSDWKGEPKEALLNKGDMLAPAVRVLPRAHLVPPRISGYGKKSAAYKEDVKRKRESDVNVSPPVVASTAAFTLPQFPPSPAFLQPEDRLHGKAKKLIWDWETGRWTHEFEDGTVLTGNPSALSTFDSTDIIPTPAMKKLRVFRAIKRHPATNIRMTGYNQEPLHQWT
ncbi:MAG: hypothetical protein Q9170_003752 [Blastenia crenularia]